MQVHGRMGKSLIKAGNEFIMVSSTGHFFSDDCREGNDVNQVSNNNRTIGLVIN